MRTTRLASLSTALIVCISSQAGISSDRAVRIDGGTFIQPVLLDENQRTLEMESFYLDRAQVSNSDFLDFIQQYPNWRRDQAPGLFRDADYLKHWPEPDALGDGVAGADRPLTRVSWYAARAYCQAQGGRLPSMDEWEYASARQRTLTGQSDDDYADALFAWYSNPGAETLAAVGQGEAGPLGVHDLHGLVLEWVEDFELLLTMGDQTDLLNGSCGDTARMMPEFDAAHYATFLRYQSRSNYSPRTTTTTLGFRCAYDPEDMK
ncbi:formylglycine-generating enzyme required for sulfatase activity [Natronospira proteinivora]|uniref:Formylglycine-generating enzyme required for sulfatase activity n=1 Tax=Natronospira proteinivora TaxID=1807133 RepID=A0ABT1G7L9_9GAMM|nr:formylglycine-generating enzyme family protein [Natronospira proteinivora]MCP1727290.1 formylglycine-generating enzyme required for sulfatase activity [Natronospira proteinivora]